MIWDLLFVLAMIALALHAYVLIRDQRPRELRMPRGWKPPARDGIQRLRELQDASPGHDLGRAEH